MPEPRGALVPQNDLCAVLGRKFRAAREAREVPLRELAAGIGVALYLLRRHEAGALMLRADKLIEAARFLGVAPSSLLVKKDSDQ